MMTKGIDRRRFLKLAGIGSAAAAAAITPGASLLANSVKTGTFSFRGVAGLPPEPLAHYASLVVQGHVDLAARSGLVTQTVFAGTPEGMSTIAFPGLSRTIRVTEVRKIGSAVHVSGVVADRSQLQKGESPTAQIRIDPSRGTAWADFRGSEISLRLER